MSAPLTDLIETALFDADISYARDIAEAVVASGFIILPGNATDADRRALIEVVCNSDIDFETYPDYVQDGARADAIPAATLLFGMGLMIPQPGTM